jgi:hypothetical protein
MYIMVDMNIFVFIYLLKEWKQNIKKLKWFLPFMKFVTSM